MSNPITTPNRAIFKAGGALVFNHPSYITRPADQALLKLILEGEFAYVLTPRQMGKSSLVNQSINRLKAQHINAIKIDLSIMGTPTEPSDIEKWYYGLIVAISRQLRLITPPEPWWEAHNKLGLEQRFSLFLEDVVLTEIKTPIVIFIDEIDKTIQLPFSDDFFATIRAFYNNRETIPALYRLTFVLLGVASPTELIDDATQTPFNVGYGLSLQDFALNDTNPLKDLLQQIHRTHGATLFKRIYHWTDGHPFLTQRLCKLVAESEQTTWVEADIDGLITTNFKQDKIESDSHLKDIQSKLLNRPEKRQLLNLYKKIYQNKQIKDDPDSLLHTRLKLSGLIKTDEAGYLQIRNQIYKHVFDETWIKEHTPTNWQTVLSTVAIATVAIALAILLNNSYLVPNKANDLELWFYQPRDATEKLTHLAALFELQGFFGLPDYDDKATTLFLGLAPEDQVALFNDGNEASVTVIEGIYELVVTVDATTDNRPLLTAMLNSLQAIDSDSLKSTAEKEKVNNLIIEIDAWLQGQNLTDQGNYPAALTAYNTAIAQNSNNSATLYERAKINIKLNYYKTALADLDKVINIARQAPTPTPTPTSKTATVFLPPTDTVIPIPTNTPTPTPTVTSTSILTTTPTTEILDSSNPPIITPSTITETPQIPPTATPTPIPVYSPTPTPLNLQFVSEGQLIAIARDLINNNKALSDALIDEPDSYANLWDFEMAPTPTIEITPSGFRIGAITTNSNDGNIAVGEQILINARIEIIDTITPITYTWSIESGTIILGQGNDTILYQAPDIPGTYLISLLITQGEENATKALSIKVNDAITDTPTTVIQTPTFTPLPASTWTPTFTPLPAPTWTPTSTPTWTATLEPQVTLTSTPTSTWTPTPPPLPTWTPTNTAIPTPIPTLPIIGRIAIPINDGLGNYDVIIYSMPDGKELGKILGARQPNFRIGDGRLLVNGETGPQAKGVGENIYLYDSNGQNAQVVSSSPEDSYPTWAPNGDTRIAYSNSNLVSIQTTGIEWHLFVQPGLSPVDRDEIAGNHVIEGMIFDTQQPLYPLWADDDYLLFRACDYWPSGQNGSNCLIYRTASWNTPAGDGFKVPQKVTNFDAIPTDTSGTNLIFMSRNAGNWDIYSTTVNGGPVNQLTNNPADDGLGTLSPDNQWVAFVSNRDNGQWAVWVIPIEGGEAFKLFDLPPNPWLLDPEHLWTRERISWAN